MSTDHLTYVELERLLEDVDLSTPDETGCRLELELLPPGIPLIRIHGRTLGVGSLQIVRQILDHIQGVAGDVILDLLECSYLSSIAMANLANFAAGRLEAGGRILVSAPNQKITNMMQIIGVDRIFTVCANLAEARMISRHLPLGDPNEYL